MEREGCETGPRFSQAVGSASPAGCTYIPKSSTLLKPHASQNADKKKKGGNISKNNCKFKNNGKQSQVTTAVPLSRLEVQGTYLEKKKKKTFVSKNYPRRKQSESLWHSHVFLANLSGGPRLP